MPHLVTKDHCRRRFLRRTICRRPVHQARGSHHERNDGIRDRGRLYIAGLLRADDAGAESPGQTRILARDGSDGGNYNYSGGDGCSVASWFIGDHLAVDSSGNPSDGGGGGD